MDSKRGCILNPLRFNLIVGSDSNSQASTHELLTQWKEDQPWSLESNPG